MIVGDWYVGDDLTLAWRQHDVYGQALDVMVRGVRQRFLDACLIAGGDAARWPADLPIDHRTLQDAHDIVAAAWRWRVGTPQGELPFGPERMVATTMPRWLEWLAAEVRGWRDDPGLVLNVVAIVTHQNTLIGDAGELRLCAALLKRYAFVDWRPARIDPWREDLA